MRYYLTIYLDVTAEDFYNWLVIHLYDGPQETFYNLILLNGDFRWTPIETTHSQVLEPNWWRYAVGLTEGEQKETIITTEEGALEFNFIQSRSNPYNPRAEVTFGWDELFPGTAWELLTHMANAYPETQPAIDSWKKTPTGQQAGVIAALCSWWNEYISQPYSALLTYVADADPNLTMDEFMAQYTQDEECVRLALAASKSLRTLPQEKQELLFALIDLAQYRYGIGCYENTGTPEEREKAEANALEPYERIHAWRNLLKPQDEESPPIPFEQWARDLGYLIFTGKDHEASIGGNIEVRRSSPGAPSNEQYDQAFTFIKSGEKTQAEAWKWYCEQTGIPANNSQVRHAFDQAIRRRLKGI